MRSRLLFACLAVIAYPAYCDHSEQLDFLLREATRLELSSHPTWRKLLHFEGRRSVSSVNSPDFFLAANGDVSPAAELDATLAAYFAPETDDGDQHPRCRFPARYYWLSRHLELPGYQIDADSCRSFNRWALLRDVESVSVYFVSGYFGNPASSFGHALLRLNTKSANDKRGLFDLTINYGALVPEGEPTLIYVARGLTGGYQAGFSDRYFYTQDQVYTRTEFRDIWDFELNLTEHERTLLILHLWEIIGKKFTYYFLKENCAYRLAELLDLAIEEPVLAQSRFWYAPVQLFHRLETINQTRIANGQPPLYSPPSPIPSSRRELYHAFDNLSPDALRAANQVLASYRQAVDLSPLEPLDQAQSVEALDALVQFQQYRQVAEAPNPSVQLKALQSEILRRRLALPPDALPDPLPKMPPPPHQTTRPRLLGAGIAVDQNGDSFPQAHLGGYVQEFLSPSSLEGGELVAVNATVAFRDPAPAIDQFELVRILKPGNARVPIAGEANRLWSLRLAMDRVIRDQLEHHDWNAAFGIGRSWRASEQAAVLATAQASAHSNGPTLRLTPQLAYHASSKRLGARLHLGQEFGRREQRTVWGATALYHFDTNRALRIQFSNQRAARAALSFVTYW